MIGNYKCECGNKIEFNKKYGKDFPKTKKCNKCGKRAKRDISDYNFSVPFHMKATSS